MPVTKHRFVFNNKGSRLNRPKKKLIKNTIIQILRHTFSIHFYKHNLHAVKLSPRKSGVGQAQPIPRFLIPLELSALLEMSWMHTLISHIQWRPEPSPPPTEYNTKTTNYGHLVYPFLLVLVATSKGALLLLLDRSRKRSDHTHAPLI